MQANEEVNQTQIGENMRFYADMRFKQLTLLMAVLSLAGAGVVYSKSNSPVAGQMTPRTIAASFAMLFTAVTWVMEIRSTLFWKTHREAAPHLWPLPQSGSSSKCGWLNASNSVLGFVLKLLFRQSEILCKVLSC